MCKCQKCQDQARKTENIRKTWWAETRCDCPVRPVKTLAPTPEGGAAAER